MQRRLKLPPTAALAAALPPPVQTGFFLTAGSSSSLSFVPAAMGVGAVTASSVAATRTFSDCVEGDSTSGGGPLEPPVLPEPPDSPLEPLPDPPDPPEPPMPEQAPPFKVQVPVPTLIDPDGPTIKFVAFMVRLLFDVARGSLTVTSPVVEITVG